MLNEEPFPTDLTGGNARISGNQVGLFDPGGMYYKPLSADDKELKTRLVSLIIQQRTEPRSAVAALTNEIRQRGEPIPEYLVALHKAMLASYDFVRAVPASRHAAVLLAALAALPRESWMRSRCQSGSAWR